MKYKEIIKEIAVNPKYHLNFDVNSFDLQGILIREMTEDEISSEKKIFTIYVEEDENLMKREFR